MKIVFVLSSLWLTGGNRVVIEHSNRLAERGHQISIVVPQNTLDSEIVFEISEKVDILQTDFPLVSSINYWDKLCLALKMVRIIPKCDIVIATHTPTTVVSLLAGWLLRKGTPVWFYQDFPEMFANRSIETWLLHHALSWHRGAIAVSHNIIQDLLSYSFGDVRYIGDALSHYEIFSVYQKQLKEISKQKQIMYLGDFRPRKGLGDFILASELVYKSFPEIELLLVLKEDGKITTQVPHQKIIRPSTNDLARFYADSDLFVSTSWKEGFGLPPLEAMACGTPVVLTDSGGVLEYAKHGENCLLVPPRQPVQLGSAIKTVLSDNSLADKLRHNGAMTAHEYTWDKVIDRMENALLGFKN